MLSWSVWHGDRYEWDKQLLNFPDFNIFQSYGWGEHKSNFGWTPYRFLQTENRSVVAMAQVLVRRLPLGIFFCWIPGGPVGLIDELGQPFKESLKKGIGARVLYCRMNSLRQRGGNDLIMSKNGWYRPLRNLLSGYSILLDLKQNDEDWLKSIAGKHRYYVKKSSSAQINWVHGNTEKLRDDFVALTEKLSDEKGMNLQERDSFTLHNLDMCMPDTLFILIGYLKELPISGCLILIKHNKAHYVSAATIKEGRELSAAYAMFSKARSLLREYGVSVLDFGGINPNSKLARGVDHFKSGFGGREIQYLGEWEWSTSILLRYIVNFFIRLRSRTM